MTFGGQYVGSKACVLGIRMECPGVTAWFRADSGRNLFKAIGPGLGIMGYRKNLYPSMTLYDT